MMELVYMYHQNKDLVLRLFIKEKNGWIKKVIFNHCDYKIAEQYFDDLQQLSYIKLYDAFEMYRFELKQDFLSYYYMFLKRMLIDFKRKTYSKLKSYDYYATIKGLGSEDRELQYLNSVYLKSLSDLAIKHKLAYVYELLEDFSMMQQKVLYLKTQGYNAKEIGDQLGIEDYHVNYIVRKVRKLLKNKIDESTTL